MNECLTIQEYRGEHPLGGSMTNLKPEHVVYGPQGRLSINEKIVMINSIWYKVRSNFNHFGEHKPVHNS